MFRLPGAIVFAAVMFCVIGALWIGGVFVYDLIINGSIGVQIGAAALFAFYVLIGLVTGGDDDGKDNA